MSIVLCIGSGLLGLVLGSFAGATVWRLRARQLVADSAAGMLEPSEKKELRRLEKLTKASLVNDRSRCLHCGHTLAWYDLLPLVSWLSTSGKCRYCKKPIGWFEPAIEIGTALLLVATYVWFAGTGVPLALFAVWVIAVVLLVILWAYDAKWFLLPNVVIFPLIVISAVIATTRVALAAQPQAELVATGGALLVLVGLYAGLYYISRLKNGEAGTWVGFGDVKLVLALALLLGSWQLALLTVFVANAAGLVAVLPGMVRGKLGLKTHVPFGPLLILGFFVALFVGNAIINWYMGLAGISM